MSKNEISVGSYKIGPDHPPFIVAEVSGNHNGSVENALKLVEAAKRAGVHAIKLQTYTPDTITLNIKEGAFKWTDPTAPWVGKNLYEVYQEAYTPWEWHKILFDRCRELGLVGFSTPFDETAVDYLEKLDVPCYKIGSLEIIDLPLIQKVARTKKPLFISVGGASLGEIDEAVKVARREGASEIVLLKCTKAYPARPKDGNLRTMDHLAKSFDTLVGLSDHTLGIGVAIASVAMGGCLIEKHFALSRSEGGVDSSFSLEEGEFQLLVQESRSAWEALGEITYGPVEVEKSDLAFRPSLYFVVDLLPGEIVKSSHVKSLRPDQGLPPKEVDSIIGLKLEKGVKVGTPVTWELFKR